MTRLAAAHDFENLPQRKKSGGRKGVRCGEGRSHAAVAASEPALRNTFAPFAMTELCAERSRIGVLLGFSAIQEMTCVARVELRHGHEQQQIGRIEIWIPSWCAANLRASTNVAL